MKEANDYAAQHGFLIIRVGRRYEIRRANAPYLTGLVGTAGTYRVALNMMQAWIATHEVKPDLTRVPVDVRIMHWFASVIYANGDNDFEFFATHGDAAGWIKHQRDINEVVSENIEYVGP